MKTLLCIKVFKLKTCNPLKITSYCKISPSNFQLLFFITSSSNASFFDRTSPQKNCKISSLKNKFWVVTYFKIVQRQTWDYHWFDPFLVPVFGCFCCWNIPRMSQMFHKIIEVSLKIQKFCIKSVNFSNYSQEVNS